ncbi:hypothetical protein AB4Z47_07205 [Nocardia sp. 2TAF39]
MVFAALMVPQVLASAQSLYPPEKQAAVFGVIGAVVGMAAVAGPLLGGLLVSSHALGAAGAPSSPSTHPYK